MLSERIRIRTLALHADMRGTLVKLFNYVDLSGKLFKDIYVTRTEPGQSRADHYHMKTTEWFAPVGGSGVLVLTELSSGEKLEIQFDASVPVIVEIPPMIHHRITAGKEGLAVVAFSDQAYREDDKDTYVV